MQLLSEEYDLLSPNTLENRGLTINLEYKRYSDLSCSPETQHKLTGMFTTALQLDFLILKIIIQGY